VRILLEHALEHERQLSGTSERLRRIGAGAWVICLARIEAEESPSKGGSPDNIWYSTMPSE